MDQDTLLGKVGQINHRAPGRGSHLPYPGPAAGPCRGAAQHLTWVSVCTWMMLMRRKRKDICVGTWDM